MPRRKSDALDMVYAGQVLHEEVKRIGGTRGVTGFLETHPESPKWASLFRIFNGERAPDAKVVLQLQNVLGWPRGTVMLLARRDFQGLLDKGIDPEFVQHAREAS